MVSDRCKPLCKASSDLADQAARDKVKRRRLDSDIDQLLPWAYRKPELKAVA